MYGKNQSSNENCPEIVRQKFDTIFLEQYDYFQKLWDKSAKLLLIVPIFFINSNLILNYIYITFSYCIYKKE